MAQLDGTTTVTVTCTPGTNYTVALNNGANFSTTRRMISGTTNFLGYELYKDAARSLRWGSTGSELFTPPGPATATPAVHTVYGRVPASPTLLPTGAYLDTVGVTVTVVP